MRPASTVLSAGAVALAIGLAGSASADVTFTLTNQTYAGFSFSLAAAPGELTGALTGASINAVLENSIAYTYADDLCVYLDSGPLSVGGALQIGGFSNLGASQRYFWPTGGSSGLGTVAAGDVVLVDDAEGAEGHPTRVMVVGEREGVAGVQPAMVGAATLAGGAKDQHAGRVGGNPPRASGAQTSQSWRGSRTTASIAVRTCSVAVAMSTWSVRICTSGSCGDS